MKVTMDSANASSPLNAILGIIKEITTCEKAGATSAAIILTYVGIDVMAYLSMPAGQTSQTRSDFINWVNKYLKADSQQVYQYDGKDVYGARCAMIHTYAVEADYHQKNAEVKQFGYHDGGRHGYDPNVNADLVIIGVASLADDFKKAVMSFFDDLRTDAGMRARVAARLPKLVQVFPMTGD
ncbi:MAG TPA: hypothetical protein VJO12_09170 [Stellaceae bacterium]|nr:hypothetical protein [Stellaceae bacterium]